MQALFEVEIDCPYCGDRFTALIDSTEGDCDYTEDCAICCQPIEFHLRIDGDDVQVSTSRSDDSY